MGGARTVAADSTDPQGTGMSCGSRTVRQTVVRTPIILSLISLAAAAVADVVADGQWLHYGNDLGGKRYSPLTQLAPDNIAGLKRAWMYRIEGDRKMTLEVTPLMVDDSVYLCSASNEIISLDAESGAERWRFDPQNHNSMPPMWRACRGVAYYRVPDAAGACSARVITATADGYLLAVDARTGKPCEAFGEEGYVDIMKGTGHADGRYELTSAPTIVRGRIVIGGSAADNKHVDERISVIRAYDAVTGAFVWAWDMGRPGEHGEPSPGETYTPGTPKSWAPMSGDETLGLVYAPMGNSTPPLWGADRVPAIDKYASAVVALDAETGEPRWSFQTVHHDIWDYDLPAQPTLVDLTIDGETVPALIQPSKQGQIYVLDRRDGKPLIPVEERPTPQDGAPGERLSSTQPFSSGMPDLESRMLTEAEMWGVTPFDQLWCRIKFHEARYEGVYTPPGLGKSISYPGLMGGMNWGGVSIDPRRQLLVVNWSRMPSIMQMIPRAEADQGGEPFRGINSPFLSPLGAPCLSPPYHLLTVVDLRTQKVTWTRRLGTARESGPFGIASRLPIPLGAPGIGGSIITGSGIVFIGATNDKVFRAFDVQNGDLLWQDDLPAGAHATPMTYLSPASGRQFVVIAAGGHAALRSAPGNYVIAYALPK